MVIIASISVLVLGLFALTFLVCRRLQNFSFVDPVWTYCFALVVAGAAWFAPGWPGRGLALVVMVAIWSTRLGTHLLRRVAAHHPKEDLRYAELRKTWATHLNAKMFAFFEAQGLSVILLSTPFFFILWNTRSEFTLLEYVGAGICAIAWAGEAIADAQLAAFKRTPAAKTGVCDVGLWRYSRHPNYFFEWLIWCGYALISTSADWGWIGWVSPAIMWHLLHNVSGIPPTEAQSLRSRGDAYRRYQQRTSPFLPLPRRN